ncbi:MAG: Panacea domain-containing protein [Intestinibacillus sp.]
MHLTTAVDVAEWFLSQQQMTHKKIQKIVYYAYAWYYALTGNKLFDGEFEAWIHGPVNRQLYSRYAGNGWNPIAPDKAHGTDIPQEEEEFLQIIYNVFGEYSADELESMTHQEKPWIEARGGIPANQSSCQVINDETMKSFYSELGKQNQIE